MTLNCAGDPPIPDNGKVTLSIPDETGYGLNATKECNPGFDLNGTAYISCKVNKSWSASPVTCSKIGMYLRKIEGKYQESIQSSTTPNPVCHMGK